MATDAEDRKPKLDVMNRGRLPANRSANLPANRDDLKGPSVPVETEVRETRGRSPEDVLADQEQQRQVKIPVEVRNDRQAPVKKAKVQGQELTLEELAKRPDLLEALATTAEKYTQLQHKHQETLEKLADKALQKSDAPAPAKPEITPEQRWMDYQQGTLQALNTYSPLAQRIIDFLVKAGKIEADAPEAYREMVTSFIADSAWKNDRIAALEDKVHAQTEWIAAEIKLRNARSVESKLHSAIDEIAAKANDKNNEDAKLYAPLLNQEMRANFVEWLQKDIDPKVGSLDAKNMDRFWKAFIVTSASDLLKVQKVETSPIVRQQASGDGRGARTGIPESPKEKSHLQKMIDHAKPGLFQRE